jgi:hypothetical protein
MNTKRQKTEQEGVYFITFTCYQRHSLFELTNSYDMVHKFSAESPRRETPLGSKRCGQLGRLGGQICPSRQNFGQFA